MRNKRLLWQLALVLTVGIAGWFGYRIGGHPQSVPPAAGTAEHKATGYTCTMHPEVHSDHPGNCPICGMKLVPEKVARPALPAERKPLYWYDPMKPDQHFDQPGKSPFMDMDLVPKYADEAAPGSTGTISLNPQMAQRLGVRLAPVRFEPMSAGIEIPATVSADEHRIKAVQARTAGWVEQLYVRAQGEPVHSGQLLAEIYAPDLYAAQQEFLLAQRAQDALLRDGARERLHLLGVSDAQIARLEKTGTASPRVGLYSPFDGVVQELGARTGMQLVPGTTLFNLVDLSRVWVLGELPEASAASVRMGQKVTVESPALPGRRFAGTVDYIYPEMTAQTRTLKLRVTLPNPDLDLRPGMFARIKLAAAAGETLLVPSEALIRTGTRSVVILAVDATHFRPVDVQTGREAGGRTEILDGLEAGQQVVTSGQFLIDSEANLRGALSKFESTTDAVSAVTTEPHP